MTQVDVVPTDGPLLGVSHVSKSFGGVQAVSDVSMSVGKGEVVALVGENGAGKSTLKNMVVGQVRPDRGTIEIGGAHVRDGVSARRLGIVAVHQELSLFPALTVWENVFLFGLGKDRRRGSGKAQARDRTRELLRQVGARFGVDDYAADLSPAEQQLVEVVKAIAQRPRVLVLDEPTSSLNLDEQERIHQTVRTLSGQGVGIIYVTHHLDEVFELTSSTVIMRDGSQVWSGPTSALDRRTIEHHMIGREVAAIARPPRPTTTDVALELRDLTAPKLAEPVSLTIGAGEVLGLAGLMGSGRTELAKSLYGIGEHGGQVLLGGRPLARRSPRACREVGIAFITEDRRDEGLYLDRPIRDNVSVASLGRLTSFGFLRPARERALVTGAMSGLRVKAAGQLAPARSLSGGNQQKLVLGKWLAVDARVLIFDEPTRGIDVGAKAEVHSLIAELAAAGKAILLISSDLPEVLGLSHRIGVMWDGHLRCVLDAAAATPSRVIRLMTGGDLDDAPGVPPGESAEVELRGGVR